MNFWVVQITEEDMSVVDKLLGVNEVCSSFGLHIRFLVQLQSTEPDGSHSWSSLIFTSIRIWTIYNIIWLKVYAWERSNLYIPCFLYIMSRTYFMRPVHCTISPKFIEWTITTQHLASPIFMLYQPLDHTPHALNHVKAHLTYIHIIFYCFHCICVLLRPIFTMTPFPDIH